jgi:glycosyltransferase involved in cell wall biosynthesis
MTMRIAIVYDCLYPHTVGGAERWYRALAERLSATHEITYLTRRQWEGDDPGTSFLVVAVSPEAALYTRAGRRRIWPPLRFGAGIFWHLLRHGARYDAVHSASFPYFSLLGAWLAIRIRRRGRLIVDWHEVWSREYWRGYLGSIGGRIGHAVQRLCISLPDLSFTFSRLHERRLVEDGHKAPLTRLTGQYVAEPEDDHSDEVTAEPLIVFAGRHIPEKRVAIVPDVIAKARRTLPELRCLIFGDGPEYGKVAVGVERLGLNEAVELRGRRSGSEVRQAIAAATCLLLPSLREGYGLVVVEAIASGTPVVVVAGSENAAIELIEPGVNGYIATSADPERIAERLVDAIESGESLRRSTFNWYREHAQKLSIDSSLSAVERSYGTPSPARSSRA